MISETLEPALRSKLQVNFYSSNPLTTISYMRQTTFLSLYACMAFLDSLTKEAFLAASQPFARQVWEFSDLQILLLVLGYGLMGITSIVFVMQPLVHFQGEVSTVRVGYVITTVAFFCLGLVGHFPNMSRETVVILAFFFGCLFVPMGNISSPTQASIASR